MSDWADEKAREWLNDRLNRNDIYLIVSEGDVLASLSILLRGVFDRGYDQGRESMETHDD